LRERIKPLFDKGFTCVREFNEMSMEYNDEGSDEDKKRKLGSASHTLNHEEHWYLRLVGLPGSCFFCTLDY